MKFRWNNYLLLVVLAAVLTGILFGLDSDLEILSRAGIPNPKAGIVVNQVGYSPQWQKQAFLRQNTVVDANKKLPTTAELIDRDTKKIVATLEISTPQIDEVSQDAIATIDFSQITQPGNYYLRSGRLKSVPFAIARDVYQQPLITLLRSYYLLRCGVKIDDPISGISHPPCHLQDGIVANSDEGKIKDTEGGWHDGGSYNKYVATTTVTVGRLLSLYAEHPDFFPDSQLNIPESGNRRSDLLDEMELALEWLLKMQRFDGAVYRKVAGAAWLLDLAPEEDLQPRYVYGISTPETAKFAAVMAIASRVFDSGERYLIAAERAWQYLANNPEMRVDWTEADDTGSDKYLASELDPEISLTIDTDDRLWAAAELYITTGQNQFANYLKENLDRVTYEPFSWKNPVSLGLVNYLNQQSQPQDSEIAQKISSRIQQQADELLNIIEQNPYEIALDRFTWGSNRAIAEASLVLFRAYQITSQAKYLNGAIAQINYLLGRNHFNRTFITAVGANSVNNLSNLYTRAKQIKIPGLVVSGANATAQDGRVYRDKKHLSYADDELAYATNGNATDYNAAVISAIVNLINY